MKGAGKIVLSVAAVSALLLIYVHEQFLLFQVSYHLNQKNSLQVKKSEDFRRLKFEVDQMKAPRLLEEQMAQLKLDLTLPKEVHVFKVPPKQIVSIPLKEMNVQPISGHLTHLLGQWIDIAQAKTDTN